MAEREILSEAEELLADFLERRDAGEPVELDDLCDAHPECAAQLRELFTWVSAYTSARPSEARTPGPDPPEHRACRTIGEYQVVRELARSISSIVLEARHPGTGQRVALKVLPEWAASDPRRRRRFEREVELQADLRHPSIVPVYDSGLASGQYYLVTPLIEGEEADVYVDRHQPGLRQRVELVREICGAIAFAHQRGVLHRDVKPSNVLIDRDGRPYVLDFGLGKLLHDTGEAALSALTLETGAVLGTPSYMSPEQAAGRSAEVDVRSDVFSLGALAYRLFSGRTPFDGERGLAHLLDEVQHAVPRPPSSHDARIPRDLDRVVAKALEKDPGARYQSAAELAEDLSAFLEDRPIRARPPSFADVLWRGARRHKGRVSLAAGLLLAALVGGTWTVVRAGQQTRALAIYQEAARLYEQRDMMAIDEWVQSIPAGLGQVDRVLELSPGFALAYLTRARLRAARIDQLGPGRRLEELDLALADFRRAHDELAPTGLPLALWEGVLAINATVFRGRASLIRTSLSRIYQEAGFSGDPTRDYGALRSAWLDELAVGNRSAYGDLAELYRYPIGDDVSVPDCVFAVERVFPVLGLQERAQRLVSRAAPNLGKHAHQGDLPAALTTIREAIARNSRDARSWQIQAELAIKQGDAATAESSALEAIALRGETYDNLILLGDARALTGRTEDAVASFRRLVERFPDEARAHDRLARALTWIPDYESGAREALEATRLEPGLEFAWSNLHLCLWKLERFEEAQRIFEEHGGTPEQPIYGVWMNQAESCYARGRTAEALELIDRLVHFVTTPSELLLWHRAVVLGALGKTAEARAAMEEARLGVHSLADVRAQIVCEYLLSDAEAMRDEAAGLELARELATCVPRSPWVETILAYTELRDGRPRAALARLEARGQLASSEPWAGLVEAAAAYELGQEARARTAFEGVLQTSGGEVDDPRLVRLFEETALRLGRDEVVRGPARTPLFEARY